MFKKQTCDVFQLAYFLKLGLSLVLCYDVARNIGSFSEYTWLPISVFLVSSIFPHEYLLVIGLEIGNNVLVYFWKVCCLIEMIMLMDIGIIIATIDANLPYRWNIIILLCFILNVLICNFYLVIILSQRCSMVLIGNGQQPIEIEASRINSSDLRQMCYVSSQISCIIGKQEKKSGKM